MSEHKSTMWYYKFPSAVYANGPVRFSEPKNEREVRAYLRELFDVPRLPRDFDVWPTTQGDVDIVSKCR